MKKSSCLAQSLVFLVFLGFFFVWNILLPDRDFSEQENRVLQTAPAFSVSELIKGKFTTKFETYVTDQFSFRDQWISLKARMELLCGKKENNGIYLCDNETLLEPFTGPEESDLQFRLDSINALADQTDIPVYFALIPTASELYSSLLPAGAPNDSQKAVIDRAYAGFHGGTVDIFSVLNDHSGDALFYRTDHHWTTLGAYYGYTAIAEAMGFAPAPLSAYSPETVTHEFYGTAYSSSGFRWIAPDEINVYVPQGEAVITNYPYGEAVEIPLYDSSALEVKDKYRYFYGGNSPLVTVDTGNIDAPSLLILRDSYMDSLSPFLFAHFSKLHILDLRYFRTGLQAYLSENDIDEILICYSVKNFCEDGNIFLAAN